MPALVLSEQGTRLTKRGERLVVFKGSDVILDVPALTVDSVQLMGQGVQISHAALAFLNQRGIPVFLMSKEGTRITSVLHGPVPRNAELRLAQAKAILEQSPQLTFLVQALISRKLAHQQTLLRRYGTHWGGVGSAAQHTLGQMEQAVQKSHDLDQIRGYEGAGAAAYWKAWRAVFFEAWAFNGRKYYPPTDPINALLSFGYTLLLNNLLAAVHYVGLDPALGVFHVPQAQRPSFALDIQEEFRPLVIDALVIEVLDSGQLQREHFTAPAPQSGAVYASKAVKKMFVQAYAQRLTQTIVHPVTQRQETLQNCIQLQLQQVARVLNGEQAAYLPLVWN